MATALLVILFSLLPLDWFVIPFLLISATAVINFNNCMDGLDGPVAGCMAVAISVLAVVLLAPWSIWALVCSLVGFLASNWSPSKVFGDLGSTFLGTVFAGLVLQAPSLPEALGLLLVATALLGDACLCVPSRLLAVQRVFQAHRPHLFQRLHQAGWSFARVSSLYIAATAALVVVLLAGAFLWWLYLLLLSSWWWFCWIAGCCTVCGCI